MDPGGDPPIGGVTDVSNPVIAMMPAGIIAWLTPLLLVPRDCGVLGALLRALPWLV